METPKIDGTSIRVLKNYCDYLERNIKIMDKIDACNQKQSVFKELTDPKEVKDSLIFNLDKNWTSIGKTIFYILLKTFPFDEEIITRDETGLFSNHRLEKMLPFLDKIRILITIAELPEKLDGESSKD